MGHCDSESKKVLPIVPPPNPHESLGGWYARMSSGYAVKVHDALPVIDLGLNSGPSVDREVIHGLSDTLFKLTDIPHDVWSRLIKPEAKLTNMWLKYQPQSEYCFPQLPNYYCIECFLEDLETRGNTFYRVDWMSPFVLSCHKHKSPLMNNKFINYENAICKLDADKFESRVNFVGHYEIVERRITKLNNNYISPMARRVSNLFSVNGRVARTAMKALGRHDDISVARSAAIAVLQILSHRGVTTDSQCIGRLLFAEKRCNEFLEWKGYNKSHLTHISKRKLITSFEQVGWFICHPQKFKRYGLKEITDFISKEYKSSELNEKIRQDQLVLLSALLRYYQRSNFRAEIKEFHPLFFKEWRWAEESFLNAVDERYYDLF